MMGALDDLIFLPAGESPWVTFSILGGRLVGMIVICAWVWYLLRTTPGGLKTYQAFPWNRPWHNLFTNWLIATGLLDLAGVIRILFTGHIRAQNDLGMTARYFEILATVNFAVWSAFAFMRWLRPDPEVSVDAVFEAITQAMPIVVADQNGIITYTTGAADEIIGAKEDELYGRNILTLMPQRYRGAHLKGFQEFRATGKGRIIGKAIEVVLLRRDGTELPVHLAVSATRDAKGRHWFTGTIWRRGGSL